MARHLKWISGVCLLCVLWVPLSALLNEGGKIPARIFDAAEEWLAGGEGASEGYDQLWQEEQQKLDLAYANEAIRELLCQRFEQSGEHIHVRVETDEMGERLTHVRVALSGRAIWLDTHELQGFIQDTFGCDSTVYLE